MIKKTILCCVALLSCQVTAARSVVSCIQFKNESATRLINTIDSAYKWIAAPDNLDPDEMTQGCVRLDSKDSFDVEVKYLYRGVKLGNCNIRFASNDADSANPIVESSCMPNLKAEVNKSAGLPMIVFSDE